MKISEIVLRVLYEELKESLSQFSKKRLALIACRMEGIYAEQWDQLRKDSGLALMTNRLLWKGEAKHINRAGNVIDTTHPVLFFKNGNCLYFKGENIFNLKANH